MGNALATLGQQVYHHANGQGADDFLRYSKTYRWDPALAPRVRLLASQGCGLIEIGAEIGIPSNVLSTWDKRRTYPDLTDLLQECRDLTGAYFLRLGRQHLLENTRYGPRINPQLMAWVAERTEPHGLRQTQELTVRQYSASVDIGRLGPEQLARLAAGEHIGAVLGSGQAPEADPK